MSPDAISQATKIPKGGEEWFKGTKFIMQSCEEFLKQEHKGFDMKNGIPRGYTKDNYANLLLVVQKYFTYEGRFHMVYSYNFRLLLHFFGNQPLELPFFYTEVWERCQIKFRSR